MPDLETLWRRERLRDKIARALGQDGPEAAALEKRLRALVGAHNRKIRVCAAEFRPEEG